MILETSRKCSSTERRSSEPTAVETENRRLEEASRAVAAKACFHIAPLNPRSKTKRFTLPDYIIRIYGNGKWGKGNRTFSFPDRFFCRVQNKPVCQETGNWPFSFGSSSCRIQTKPAPLNIVFKVYSIFRAAPAKQQGRKRGPPQGEIKKISLARVLSFVWRCYRSRIRGSPRGISLGFLPRFAVPLGFDFDPHLVLGGT